jgi:hypothetical protein
MELCSAVRRKVPAPQRAAILHDDLKLDNC